MKTRNLVLLAVLAGVVVLAGCSCKEYEDQIMALEAAGGIMIIAAAALVLLCANAPRLDAFYQALLDLY